MRIPKIIHQTWKTNKIPKKWRLFQRRVIELHPDWDYELWTDEDNNNFVKECFPDFYEIYRKFPRNIMRADVIRYLIMYDIGGLYLDLDYEMIKRFDFEEANLVLPKNRSKQFGDTYDGIGNCVFASIPKHQFWKDVINDLRSNYPVAKNYTEVVDATGPLLLTSIYYKNDYSDVEETERLYFHPPSPRNEKEYKEILNNGVSYGIHHGWGSWKERFTWGHVKKKVQTLFKKQGK